MTSELLLHSKTLKQVSDYLQKPSHGLLVAGLPGSGKYALAKEIASSLLGLKAPAMLDSYPYYYELNLPDTKSEIPIELVRNLIKKLHLRTTGSGDIRRAVIIEDANYLSTEAQNSLLKTLEEPPVDTVLILTAPSGNSLLPTIVSRLHKLQVYSVDQESAIRFYSKIYDRKAIESAWALSGGAAGLLSALLQEDQTHPLKASVQAFKDFLSADKYSRLILLDKMDKDKPALIGFIDAGIRIMSALHTEAIKRTDQKPASQILNKKKRLLEAMSKLQANTSPKLVILDLALNL